MNALQFLLLAIVFLAVAVAVLSVVDVMHMLAFHHGTSECR